MVEPLWFSAVRDGARIEVTDAPMHRLPLVATFAAITAAATTAVAEPVAIPRATIGVSLYMMQFPTTGFHLALAARLRGTLYLDAQASFGAHVRIASEPVEDDKLWSAQVGTSSITWSEHAAVGARASAGYLAYHYVIDEALYDEPEVYDLDMIYGEAAFFVRLRLGSRVALEALLAARIGALTSGDGISATGYMSAGTHVTI